MKEGLLSAIYLMIALLTYIWYPMWLPQINTWGDLIIGHVVLRTIFSLLWPLTWLVKLMEQPL